MKWLFTGHLPDIEELVRQNGDDVVSSPGVWWDTYMDPEEPDARDFPLNMMLCDHVVEVCVLVNPSTPPGIRKSHAVRWSRDGRHKTLVGWSVDDPDNISFLRQGALTGCKCKPSNYDLYVTNHPDSAKFAARGCVTILYEDNFEDVYSAILEARIDPKAYKFRDRLITKGG